MRGRRGRNIKANKTPASQPASRAKMKIEIECAGRRAKEGTAEEDFMMRMIIIIIIIIEENRRPEEEGCNKLARNTKI